MIGLIHLPAEEVDKVRGGNKNPSRLLAFSTICLPCTDLRAEGLPALQSSSRAYLCSDFLLRQPAHSSNDLASPVHSQSWAVQAPMAHQNTRFLEQKQLSTQVFLPEVYVPSPIIFVFYCLVSVSSLLTQKSLLQS